MSFLSKLLFSGAAAEPIEVIGNVFDKIFTSDEERLKAQFALEKLRQHPFTLQAELNKLEVKHSAILVAGWRPFIGWVCGLGLANTFLINPWLQWFTGMSGPELPSQLMMEFVVAMLGLGALRTVEKVSKKT